MSYRYSLDRIGEQEWVLFDGEKKGTPKTYLLFLMPVKHKLFNYQLILTSYDAVASSTTFLPVLNEEIYSLFFFSVEEGLEPLVLNIFHALQDLDIDDPLELAHALGGTVRSRLVKAPTVLHSN